MKTVLSDHVGPLTVVIDHCWAGLNEPMLKRAESGEARALRVATAVSSLLGAVAEDNEPTECVNCQQQLRCTADLQVISVLQLLEPDLTICLPFCASCATSPEEVGRMAKEMLGSIVLQASGTGLKQ